MDDPEADPIEEGTDDDLFGAGEQMDCSSCEKRDKEVVEDSGSPKKAKGKAKISAAEMALEVAKDKKAAAALQEHAIPRTEDEGPQEPVPVKGTATEGGSSSKAPSGPKAKPAAGKNTEPATTAELAEAQKELLELQREGLKVHLAALG